MSDSPLLTSKVGNVTVVRFSENAVLDTLVVEQMRASLLAMLDAPGPPRIVIEFQNVDFISSAALGVFALVFRRAAQTSAQVVFSQIRPELMPVFSLTSLNRMFRIFESTSQATAFLDAPPA